MLTPGPVEPGWWWLIVAHAGLVCSLGMGWYSRRAQLETVGCTAHICHGLSWGYWTRAGATEPLCGTGENVEDLAQQQIPSGRAWPVCGAQKGGFQLQRGIVAGLHWCVHMHMHVCMYVCVCASCWPTLYWRVAPRLSWGCCPILGAHGLMLGPLRLTSSFFLLWPCCAQHPGDCMSRWAVSVGDLA